MSGGKRDDGLGFNPLEFLQAVAGDSDVGQLVPRSDGEDLRRGAKFIPGQVTEARRRGEKVNFVVECGMCCWYWQFADGRKHYHFDAPTAVKIAQANGHQVESWWDFQGDQPGPCPDCGNQHTTGGLYDALGNRLD